jgi:hypothetical protein
MRRKARRRSLVVSAIFATATLVPPRLGFALICGGLLVHVRPEAGGHGR